MSLENDLRLFLYNCAVIHGELKKVDPKLSSAMDPQSLLPENNLIKNFELKDREKAIFMARWYVLFYLLENDVRSLIRDTLSEQAPDWWEKLAPEGVRKAVEENRKKEIETGVQFRSDDPLEYTTFGQLGDIIRANYSAFGGILNSEKAMGRIFNVLNALRGPIAHCGYLAPDEVDRLRLSVNDWFRLQSAPGRWV